MTRIASLCIGLTVVCGAATAELRVVATLSTFADLVRTIGGEHVEVESIAPPQFNPHFIDPRPSDVLAVKKADVFVHSGLDLEAWRESLLKAAGNPGAIRGGAGEIDLSHGVRLLNAPEPGTTRAAGDIHLFGNPHFWLGPENGLIMAATIARRLSEIDPAHADDYEANRAAFASNLEERMEAWREALTPYAEAEVVAYHDQWPYFAEFAGVKVEQFLEPKPGIPPGPRHLATVESYIRANGVKGIVYASVFPSKPAESLAKKTGVPAIALAQGVGEVKPATDYIALIQYNVDQLTRALEK